MERHTTRACSGTYDGKDHAEMRGVAMSSLSICARRATVDDAPTVSALAQRLLTELGGFPRGDPEALVSFCRQLLASEQYTAFLAVDDATGTSLGLLTLNECSALYVAGRLGWIQELYVAPEARSKGVGWQLIAVAIAYGQKRGWQRLEVNTPEVQAWPRTVAFSRRAGFLGGSSHLRLPLA
jgi:GNAT superfamily N-acetyltransferase